MSVAHDEPPVLCLVMAWRQRDSPTHLSRVDPSKSRKRWSQTQTLAPALSYPLITPELDVINLYGHISESNLVFRRNTDDYDDDDAGMMRPGDSEDLFGFLPSSVLPRGSPSLGTDLSTSPIRSRKNLSKPNSSSNFGLSRRRSSSKHSLGSRRGSSNLGPICPVPRASASRLPQSSPQLCAESSLYSPQPLDSMPEHPSRPVILGSLAPTPVGGSMNQSNPSLTNFWNHSNPRNQSFPRIQSNPSLNLLGQRIISAHQITLNHKLSGGTTTRYLSGGTTTRNLSGGIATRKSSGGTTTRNSPGGNPTHKSPGGIATRKSSGGTTTRNLSGGIATRKSPGGTETRKSSGGTWTGNSPGGTATRKSSGGTATRKSSGGTWTRNSPGGIATRKSSGGNPTRKSPSGTASHRDSCSRLLGKSAVGSTRTPAYVMTDLEDFSVGQKSCHPRASLPTPSLSNHVPTSQPDDAAKCGVSAWGEDSFDHSRRSAGKVKPAKQLKQSTQGGPLQQPAKQLKQSTQGGPLQQPAKQLKQSTQGGPLQQP
eukprot:gene15789-21912_t